MDFFVTTSSASHSYRVLRTKEELLEAVSKMVDDSIEKGCTYFDLIINTDADTRGEHNA